MSPLILTNAFRRPSATLLPSGIQTSKDSYVYACVEEMVTVIRDDLGSSPLLLPANFDETSVARLLQQVDGIMLPGAVSNIDPVLYGQERGAWPQVFDKAHDAVDLFLITKAREMSIPFLGICRSMQAMNLVFGGSLHQRLASSSIDHSCSNPCDGHKDEPRYMHDILLEKNGRMAELFEQATLSVNSMHEQGIDRLGDDLQIEARAPDGVIEAISWSGAPNFFLAVQWHPEAMPQHPVSQALFGAFRRDVEQRARMRG